MKHQLKALSPLLLTLLLVSLSLSVSFTSNVSINNNQLSYTDDDLVCSWGASADTTSINVTWYRDGTKNRSIYDPTATNTSDTIPANDTTKHETWSCVVRLSNGTNTTSQQDNITIQNSAPSSPVIYNMSGEDIGNSQNGDVYQLTEDVTTLLDANSSDLDNDVLTYYFKTAGICTITNASTGATSCTPTHTEIANASDDESATLINITFWVDDDDPIFAASGSTKVTFNITPVNDEPALSIPNQTTNVTAIFNKTFTASDEETDYPLNASLDLPGTDDEIEGDVTVSMDDDTTVRIVYYTDPVDYNDVGNRSITINLTDHRGASILTNFTLEITAVNRQPYLINVSPETYNSSQDRTYVLNQGEHLSINVTVNDPDAATNPQTITFSDDTTLFDIITAVPTASSTQNASGHINFTATNDDVGTHHVTITFQDQLGGTNTTTLNFTVQNRNDPPTLYNESYDDTNTGNNHNLTHFIAYLNAPFRFQINYTDPDQPYGETLTFIENSTNYNISASGLINFTPTGNARNETVNITLRDNAGEEDMVRSQLEIRANSAPYFNESYPHLTCYEGQECSYNASSYARDDDDGIDTINASGNLPEGFNMTDGFINFTPAQRAIGNYTITITITDTRGASAAQDLNMTIENVNDVPVWERYDFSNATIVAGKQFHYQLQASDEDLLLKNSTENISFTENKSFATITYLRTDNDTITALLTLAPTNADVGQQRIVLNATDRQGATNTTIVNFTVHADTDPPNITHYQPYANATHELVRAWAVATADEENLTLDENTSAVLFAVNATDDDQAGPPYNWLNYTWYYDGAVVQDTSGSNSYTRSFDFFSSGSHNLTVIVNDTRLESSAFSWLLTVRNVNRAPTLEHDLEPENITGIDSTTTYTDYFVYNNLHNHFFDADDDTNSNGRIDGNETVGLSYSSTACSVATLTAVDNSLKITPVAVGTCSVQFTATDSSGASVTSNIVTIEVTEVPEGEDSSTSTSSSGGGSSSSSSRSTFVPYESKVETPQPLNLIAPGEVTIFENQTATIPFTLRNNWTGSIKDIELSADTNASGVEVFFDHTHLKELPVNGEYTGELTVVGYRLGEHFEIRINAAARSPKVEDSALVLFATIEQTRDLDGLKDVNVKVTFARDLLSANSECQELGALLDEAENQLRSGNYHDANKQLDQVINGCRYLISSYRDQEQQPAPAVTLGELRFSADDLRTFGLVGIGLVLLLIVLGLYAHHRTKEHYDF